MFEEKTKVKLAAEGDRVLKIQTILTGMQKEIEAFKNDRVEREAVEAEFQRKITDVELAMEENIRMRAQARAPFSEREEQMVENKSFSAIENFVAKDAEE